MLFRSAETPGLAGSRGLDLLLKHGPHGLATVEKLLLALTSTDNFHASEAAREKQSVKDANGAFGCEWLSKGPSRSVMDASSRG